MCNRFFYPDDKECILGDGDVVCVHNWFVPDFLKKYKAVGKFKIITANGDAPLNAVLTQDELFEFLDHEENVTEWMMAQSWYDDHPKIKYLPIGFGNTREQNEYLLKNANRLRDKPKKNAVYYNFTITNKYERLLLPNSESKSYEEYLEEMSNYKYVMCPPGVGIDIHKFYDAVAVGCIPVVKSPASFVRMYEGKYNFVSLPGQVHCSYILGAPHFTEALESVYIPENSKIQNSIDLVTIDLSTLDLRMSKEDSIKHARRVHEKYGEYFRNIEMKLPKTSVIDHYTWLVEFKKCNHGYITFL